MNNLMIYKNYVFRVEFSETDGVFYGKVQGTPKKAFLNKAQILEIMFSVAFADTLTE